MKKVIILLMLLFYGVTLTSEDVVVGSFGGKEVVGPYCPFALGPCTIPPY